ncbi:MAG: ectonucleotide pyrophosphatase/phosphodiesterase [Gammaproteobacteria bacterium]|nr:ectonucleotide pyrophosphatase/phosphodiesterase [Gammaproteobacteria bacterium]
MHRKSRCRSATLGVLKRVGQLVLLAGCCWVSGALAADSGPATDSASATVILLSWDGMRHDYPDRGSFPGLKRMQNEGVRAGRLTPVYPSSTFPAHVSLATGTYPDRHGIVGNQFFDRTRTRNGGSYRMSSDADWIQAEPLWIAAERQGVLTATYFWVGSETDWHGQRTKYRIAPFDGQRRESAKVDQILAWLRLAESERPRLIMSYWAGADSVGHRFGPDSDRIIEQIASQDAQLQRLLTGIEAQWQTTTLIIVSDHGMAETNDYIDLRAALAEAGIAARVSGGEAVAQIVIAEPDDDAQGVARAGVVLAAIDGVEVHAGYALPDWMRLAHPTRTGDWVVTTEPPHTLSRPGGFEGALAAVMSAMGWSFGGHGYHPDRVDMGGIFFALGRGVRNDVNIPVVRQVDVAATVALLLGIDPPRHSEGRPIAGIGDRPPAERTAE